MSRAQIKRAAKEWEPKKGCAVLVRDIEYAKATGRWIQFIKARATPTKRPLLWGAVVTNLGHPGALNCVSRPSQSASQDLQTSWCSDVTKEVEWQKRMASSNAIIWQQQV